MATINLYDWIKRGYLTPFHCTDEQVIEELGRRLASHQWSPNYASEFMAVLTGNTAAMGVSQIGAISAADTREVSKLSQSANADILMNMSDRRYAGVILFVLLLHPPEQRTHLLNHLAAVLRSTSSTNELPRVELPIDQSSTVCACTDSPLVGGVALEHSPTMMSGSASSLSSLPSRSDIGSQVALPPVMTSAPSKSLLPFAAERELDPSYAPLAPLAWNMEPKLLEHLGQVTVPAKDLTNLIDVRKLTPPAWTHKELVTETSVGSDVMHIWTKEDASDDVRRGEQITKGETASGASSMSYTHWLTKSWHTSAPSGTLSTEFI
jgi:hypothetical protein